MKPFQSFASVVKLGKKGQLTLPKKLRDFYQLEEDDEFNLERLPSGDIKLAKRTVKSPEDKILEAIAMMQGPPIDVDAAWEAVLAERLKERS